MKLASIMSITALLVGSAFLIAQNPAVPTAPGSDKAMQLVKDGQKLNTEGKQQEAIDLYKQALALQPKLYEAYLSSGIALDLLGRYDEAREQFTRAIELATPETKVGALRSMGISYAFTRLAYEAATYDQQAFNAQVAAQKYSDAAGTANELARICLESGDSDMAFTWYKKGYETALRDPKLSDADKSLWAFRWENAQARIAARRGQHDEAEKHVAAAKTMLDQAKNPDQARFWPYLTGYVAFYGNDYPAAITHLQKADQRDPFILLLLAESYEKTGQQTQAMELYRKILTINTHNPTNAFARPTARAKVGAH